MFTADIQKIKRNYLPEGFILTNWETLEPFLKELLERELTTPQALEQWLLDQSELEAAISENACWRQINMTCDTENKALEEAFNFYFLEIQPKIQPYSDALNKKLITSPLLGSLDNKKYYTYIRNVRKSIDLFREENIPLQAEMAVLQQQFGQVTGAMMVTVNGKEYTLQQAAKFLENPDRDLREDVYRKIQERRLQDKEKLNELFDKLVQLRDQESRNAGFESYTGFRFKELGRFDYNKEDCFRFHEAVKQYVLPLVNAIYQKKKEKLGLTTLRPWDLDAEPAGVEPLRPFTTGEELLQKSIDCFNRLSPFFGECLIKMRELKHLDLESRKGKA
ncbi:MAG TPA: M3 family metallopeptidase, partial [Ferruginibacter sp.]|nr:M3 family metallopeptidase [Ferruginibacter sp.]